MGRYRYYDSPDGQDIDKKLLVTGRYATNLGIITGTVDVMLLSHSKGFGNIAARYGYYLAPFIGMAAAFTSTTYIATNMRKKDDEINYVFGGIAAGTIYGTWQRSVYVGFVASMVFATVGYVKKSSIVDGWEFFPAPTYQLFHALNLDRGDFTLIKDPKDSQK